MVDYPNIPMPQLLNMQMGAPGKANPNANGEMGMKMLQAALAQNKQAPGAAQPAVGATMPGGAMNITPPTGGGLMGFPQVGILQKLLGNLAGGSGLGGVGGLIGGGGPGGLATGGGPGGLIPMDSTNAIF